MALLVFIACVIFIPFISEGKEISTLEEVETMNITVIEGNKVTLPCKVENLGRNDLVVWVKRAPIHEVLLAYGPAGFILLSPKSPRIAVINYWLEIKDVKLEDSGLYECFINRYMERSNIKQARYLNVISAAEASLKNLNQRSAIPPEEIVNEDSEYIEVSNTEKNVTANDSKNVSIFSPVEFQNTTLASNSKNDISTRSERSISKVTKEIATSNPENSINSDYLSSMFDASSTSDYSSSTPEISTITNYLSSMYQASSNLDNSSVASDVLIISEVPLEDSSTMFDDTTTSDNLSSPSDVSINTDDSSAFSNAPKSSDDSTNPNYLSSVFDTSSIEDDSSSTPAVSIGSDDPSSFTIVPISSDDSSSNMFSASTNPNYLSSIFDASSTQGDSSTDVSTLLDDSTSSSSTHLDYSSTTFDATITSSSDSVSTINPSTDSGVASSTNAATTSDDAISNSDFSNDIVQSSTISSTSSEDLSTSPNTDESAIATDKSSSQSSIFTTELKTTTVASDVVTEHLHHIVMPGLRKLKLGLAIAFLTISMLAMVAIVTFLIKRRRPFVPYEELRTISEF